MTVDDGATGEPDGDGDGYADGGSGGEGEGEGLTMRVGEAGTARERRGGAVWLLGVVCVVLLAGVVVFAGVRGASGAADRAAQTQAAVVQSAVSAAQLAGEAASIPASPATTAIGEAVPAPWAAPADPRVRAAMAGFGLLTTEGTALHIHAHLTVTVNGVRETVPGEVGIDQVSGLVSPLHTHDTTGILHIESPVQADFTLGQFFTEWNVALDGSRVGSYGPTDGSVLTVFVDRVSTTADPASIVFTNKMDIDLVYGPASTPAVPPTPFVWPAQY
ncbi:hypothetical protein [Subtercola vilae]|uniref:hypothetical protein n=1 Tax=Subtercola vilae TaxID=2056433 RepID=UPI0010AA4356|nr:hypothetical protein [Subtercola vilae]